MLFDTKKGNKKTGMTENKWAVMNVFHHERIKIKYTGNRIILLELEEFPCLSVKNPKTQNIIFYREDNGIICTCIHGSNFSMKGICWHRLCVAKLLRMLNINVLLYGEPSWNMEDEKIEERLCKI